MTRRRLLSDTGTRKGAATATTGTKNDLFLVQQTEATNYAVMSLNNPPVNRLDTPLIRRLTAQLEKFEDDPALRGVIITSVFLKLNFAFIWHKFFFIEIKCC